MSLRIEVYPAVNGNQYVLLEGRLDSHTHEEFDARLAPLLADGTRTLALDLGHLHYISSAGIRSILKARKALAPRNGRVLLVHPQEQVRKVIELVQAVPLEQMFASGAEADAYIDAMQRDILGH